MKPIVANLICGAMVRNHDFDFARFRLAEALYEAGDIHTNVWNDYNDPRVTEGDLLISYTARLPISEERCRQLRDYLERGGRWVALHASNSVGDENAGLYALLGSKLITHAPYQQFSVALSEQGDPLLEGIESFAVDDELYVSEYSDDIEVLMSATWGGEGINGVQVASGDWPQIYKRKVGAGEVLYMALGHCNRPYDRPPNWEIQPDRRGPWNDGPFQQLVQRSVTWAARRGFD